MGLKIGTSSSGISKSAPKAKPAPTRSEPVATRATGDTDRVSKLPKKEAQASPTPNFGAWGQAPKKSEEKQLRLREGMLLSDGSRGSKVKGLQYMLNKHGEELKKDGIFGPKTLESVRKLQQEHGLKVDGIVGPETLKVLNSPRRKADSQSKPEAKPEAKPQAQPKPEAKPEPEAQPKPEAKPEPKPEAQPKPEAKPEPKPEAQPKPPEFGLSPKTLASLSKSGKLELLRQLPPDVAGRYEKMSPKARETMFTQLSGSTWGNSHRDAFVSGKVMGMDTFSYMDDQVKAKVGRGQMSAKEADGLRADLQQLKKLSPKQRDAIAEMILLQQGK